MSEILVVMRLADMTRVHPAQDNSRVCSRCGERVGLYPSGQRVLRARPQTQIVCHVCILKDRREGDIGVLAPGALEEFFDGLGGKTPGRPN
jgi:hypothetical protein